MGQAEGWPTYLRWQEEVAQWARLFRGPKAKGQQGKQHTIVEVYKIVIILGVLKKFGEGGRAIYLCKVQWLISTSAPFFQMKTCLLTPPPFFFWFSSFTPSPPWWNNYHLNTSFILLLLMTFSYVCLAVRRVEPSCPKAQCLCWCSQGTYSDNNYILIQT